ncbi:MAG: DNA repair protein RadC, partial [Desulfobulbaceae bacterium]|nr:DNA repair protein RadC [Desulfobulbaceae bacterium]
HGLARRYLKHRIEGKNYLRSSKEVADYLIHSMRDLPHEIFKVIFLDADHGIITTKRISTGTITANTIYPREVIKSALKYNAAAMIIAHNHPSGNSAPSPEDKRLTRSMHLTCALMNIRLLDHLIIAGSDTPFSFADNGLMESLREECASILTKP